MRVTEETVALCTSCVFQRGDLVSTPELGGRQLGCIPPTNHNMWKFVVFRWQPGHSRRHFQGVFSLLIRTRVENGWVFWVFSLLRTKKCNLHTEKWQQKISCDSLQAIIALVKQPGSFLVMLREVWRSVRFPPVFRLKQASASCTGSPRIGASTSKPNQLQHSPFTRFRVAEFQQQLLLVNSRSYSRTHC